MSAIQMNSNSNSSLINTLESSDSMENPNVYSTKTIYPSTSTTWTRCEKSNGVSENGSQQNFNLNKYGIVEQILFTYTKSWEVAEVPPVAPATVATIGSATLQAGDMFNVIDRIELLSSSRVISILTQSDLISQFSNLDGSQYQVIKRTGVDERGTQELLTARDKGVKVSETYTFPLTFGFFQDINTQLNVSFVEPISIRVVYGANANQALTGTPLTTDYLTSTFLYVRYKSYSESATAQILASNYNQPELIQVSSRFYDESPEIKKNAGTGSAAETMTCQLRNTDCVQSFYVMVRKIDSANNTLGNPVQINEIVFRGSGQEILKLDSGAIQYGKLTENGFSMGQCASDATDTANMRNVAKIQTGLWENSGGGKLSNTLSLREINAPEIEVTFDSSGQLANTQWRMDVAENCTAIYSTSSAVGRLSLALSN